MARTYLRFLVAVALAIAIEPVAGALHVIAPSFGLSNLALAQNYPTDPISGAPAGISSNGIGMPGGGGFGTNSYVPSNYGPNGPTQPTSPSRPTSWPGGPADPGSPYSPPARAGSAGGAGGPPLASRPAPPTAGPPLMRPKKSPAEPPYDPAEIIAYVGSECIQASEVLPYVNQRVATVLAKPPEGFDKLPPAEKENQLNMARRMWVKQALEETIKIKLLLAEVRRKVPNDAMTKHEEQVRKFFNANEIKPLMAQTKATSTIDLDNKLREQGSSLDAQRSAYVERQMALSWMSQQVKDDVQEVTHEQMLNYYREHLSDWETPARVRWEQISVKFQNYDSKAAAHNALARWGNDVFRGAPFAAVAKAHSQEVAAEEGGSHDWVGKGSLRSTVLDEALFKLPVGALSQVLEDEDGFHILRVVQRDELKRTPFTEVQPEIKKILQAGDKDQHRTDYIAKLRERTRVLTIFDDDFVARTSAPDATKMR